MKPTSWWCAAIAMVLVASSAGCGSKKEGDGEGKAKAGAAAGLASCNTKVGECSEYNADNRALGDDHLKKLCENFEGTFATTGCPAASRLGSCSKDEGTKVYYQGYPMEAAALEKSCTETAGTWRAP